MNPYPDPLETDMIFNKTILVQISGERGPFLTFPVKMCLEPLFRLLYRGSYMQAWKALDKVSHKILEMGLKEIKKIHFWVHIN